MVDWDCCLGGGGEGEVYLGRSIRTWELCAVKVSSCLDPEAARQQLGRELDRCFRVAGSGVVGLLAWNLDAPRPFLVFELARAGTLADEMKSLSRRGRVYHPRHALGRIRDVLGGLKVVHSRGVLHRDVKPANVLKFADQLKLADFGTGRTLDRPSGLDTDVVVGTRLYAAPEQLRGEPVDERSDLYAVGCMLHEMLTGHVPSQRRLPRTALLYPDVLVLPELDRLLSSLLAEDPLDRPRDARDALNRVDSVLASYAEARRVWQQAGLGASPY